jgi:SAM-dependent methyltransferase
VSTQLERIEDAYRRHHSESRSEDFVFCGPERSALFRDWVGSGRRVLDLGCRYGALTQAYAPGNSVVGVDVDRAALAEAAKLGIETVWADVDEPLPFDDASFDAVVAGELLEHVRFPDRLVGEVHRLLRPGGLFAGSVPNVFRLKSRLRFLMGRPPEFQDDPTHLRIYTEGDLRRLLGAFAEVRVDYVAGRLVPLHARLFANDVVFRAARP